MQKNGDFIQNRSDLRTRQGVLTSVIGLILNLILGGAKLTFGILFGSVALLGDAVNNILDSVGNAVTALILAVSGKKEDKEHPFGHGRYEYLATLAIGILILFTGYEFATTGIGRIQNPSEISSSTVGIIVLALTIAVKLLMAVIYSRRAREINSSALKSAAIDSLLDAITTSTVLISLIIAPFLPFVVDGYCTLLVSLVIIWSGIRVIHEATSKLIGDRADGTLVSQIYELVLNSASICGAHDLIIHDYGSSRKLASIHAEFDDDLPISVAHDIIDSIESEALTRFGTELVVHVDYIDNSDPIVSRLRVELSRSLSAYGDASFHELKLDYESKTLMLDVKLSDEYELSVDEIRAVLGDMVGEHLPEFSTFINFDILYHDN